jgi:hypothetical protein
MDPPLHHTGARQFLEALDEHALPHLVQRLGQFAVTSSLRSTELDQRACASGGFL